MVASFLSLAGPDVLMALVAATFLMFFTTWMLVDCLQHEPEEKNRKFIWLAVILFVPVLGPVAYFLRWFFFPRKVRGKDLGESSGKFDPVSK